MKVASEFVNSILQEDVKARSARAAGTTEFLEQEVKRLEAAHDGVIAKLSEAQKNSPTAQAPERLSPKIQSDLDQLAQNKRTLATLQAEMAQKSTVYADQHPVMKSLRNNIAAVKQLVATSEATIKAEMRKASGADPAAAADASAAPLSDADTLSLTREEADLQKSLEDANQKLIAARLGETMEKNQQGERLQVIDQPSLPSKPVRPKKLTLLIAVFGLAAVAGLAAVLLRELLDRSIRGARDLADVVDRNFLISIPFVSTAAEDRLAWRRLAFGGAVALAISAAAIGVTSIGGFALDTSSTPPQT